MFIYDQQELPNAEARKKQLYVTWFAEDDALAEPILKQLKERGTAAVLSRRDLERCRHDNYLNTTLAHIDHCNVGLVMLSKAVFREDNRELQQLMWYEIGYMMSLNQKLVLFFLDIPARERNDYLNTTPVRQIQGTDQVDALMEILEKMDVQEKIFYEDLELNRFASKRIHYVKLTTLFQIYKNDMDEIFREVQRMDEDVEDRDELLTEFLSELNCGCTVLSFGDPKKFKHEMDPYIEEADTLIRDYPIRQNYSKPKLMNKDASPEVYATVQVEFALPVHGLLGVCFKPYLSVNRISHFKPKYLERIIQSNSMGANAVPLDCDTVTMKTEKEQRLYFLLDMYSNESWGELTAYGERLNYLWPQ